MNKNKQIKHIYIFLYFDIYIIYIFGISSFNTPASIRAPIDVRFSKEGVVDIGRMIGPTSDRSGPVLRDHALSYHT